MSKQKEGRTSAKSRRPKQMGGGSSGLSQRIRELRRSHGLKQSELAEMLGQSTTAVSLWERDNPPSLDNLRSLAEFGKVTLDWLVEGRKMFPQRLKDSTDEQLRALQKYCEEILEERKQGATGHDSDN